VADLWRLPATEIARVVRTGQASAREVIDAHIARIEAVEPQLNAFGDLYVDEARATADAADRVLAAGEPIGPLHGVPASIKLNTDEAGHATTNGVPAWAQRIAAEDAVDVARLRSAGAVFVGRSNTPAFSMRWCAENDLHGRTHNPWHHGRTPGGSSGGAAAAVASGMVALAQGNDYGGSIRYPAHACGIAGLRPTAGLVPRALGVSGGPDRVSWQLMAVQGPIARTVGDLRVALEVMAGVDYRDPFSVPAAPSPVRAGPRRVGLLRDPGVVAPDPAVDQALDAAAGWLADAGYAVEEVDLGLFAEAYRLWYLLAIEDNRRDLPLIEELGGEGAATSLRTQLAVAAQWWPRAPSVADVLEGYERRGAVIRELHEVLHEIPLLLMPVSAEQAFEHGEDIASDATAIRLAAAQWSCMALPLLGVPGLSVSAGVYDRLPVGVQLVGGRFQDHVLLDAGEVIEARAEVPSPVELGVGYGAG
jgi:amidase